MGGWSSTGGETGCRCRNFNALKLFRIGADVDFVRPGIPGLLNGMNDGSSNGVGRDDCIVRPIRFPSTKPWGVDLTIDHHVNHVNSLRVKFPRKGLA